MARAASAIHHSSLILHHFPFCCVRAKESGILTENWDVRRFKQPTATLWKKWIMSDSLIHHSSFTVHHFEGVYHMATAKEGDVVKVEYTGKFDDGSVFDSSEGREPLQFKLGANDVIPGFEQAVTGMNIGDSKTVKIPAEDAYGPHQDDLAMVVDRSEFPDDLQPEIGDRLQLTDDDGRVLVVTVTEASPKTLTLDANHPLAGKDLTFDIKLVEVKG